VRFSPPLGALTGRFFFERLRWMSVEKRGLARNHHCDMEKDAHASNKKIVDPEKLTVP
jgi:hypothetical protein